MAKKFPLGRVKELAAHVKGLHEHLQSLIADCDADAPASDNSDAGEQWAGDSARRVRQAYANEPAVPMDKGIPGIGRKLTLY
jgi:hypothetical protein